MSILLPLVVLELWNSLAPGGLPEVVRYVLPFVIAVAAAEAGLLLWNARSLESGGRDVLIGLVAGFGGWIASRLAMMQGGAAVGPALLALITAYILALWPNSRRQW